MQTVVITGGTSGIGLATTKLFLQNHWQVMMVARNREKGQKVQTELAAQYPHQVEFFAADVSSPDEVNALHVATTKRFGTVNALVNDAGMVVQGKLHKVNEADWDRVFDVNVKGTYLVSKAFLPNMIAQREGSIVNISSVSGMGGDYAMVAYNATKGAVINMTRAMAMDYGENGIRVNTVAPGPTNTPMFPQNMKKRFAENSPLGRIVEPEEVASAIYFVTSPAAKAITGEVIPVTAGFEISTGQPKLAE